MAETDFGQLSAARKKVWSSEVWKHGRDQSFWFSSGFVGEGAAGMNRPIHRVSELTETERGTECVMQLVQDLVGDGVVGDNELEGNEESLVNDTQTIRYDQLRHAVKNKGRMSEARTVIRFRAQAKEKLTFWLGDTLDELMFLTASGRAYSLNTDGTTRTGSQLPQLAFANDVAAASTNRIRYGGTATAESNITTSDKMSYALIVKTCAFAKRKRVKPIREGGREYYCIVMSTEQTRDLKQDSDYLANVRNAGPRSMKDNPLFTGALAVVDGVILYEHNKVFNTLGLGASAKWGAAGAVDGAQALLMGAQALGLATIGEGTWGESDLTDYGNKAGIGYGRKIGMLKPRWISPNDGNTREDYGIVSIKTAAAA